MYKKTADDSMDLVDNVSIGKGCLLGERYRMIEILNTGNFGFVTKCVNIETRKTEAIKLIDKSNPDLFCQATNEITILWRLQHLDPYICNIGKLNDVFCHKDYICLTFELLDQDLYDYVYDRQGGLPMSEIRPIIHQLATALYHLSSIGIVHADIKPENVMLVDRSRQPLKVKLIDFGLAYPVHGKPCAVVQTVGYRAPEVMLDIPFDEAIDMWSLGVTAAELAAGFHPYKTGCYFNRQTNGQHRWRFKTPQEFKNEMGCAQKTNGYRLDMLPKLMDHGDPSDRHLLLHLIKKMLQLDADDRIKPLEVLQHPFFTYSLHQSSWNKASGPENIPGRVERCLLGECHLLVDNLGEGGFGFVTRCFNIEKCKMEAVKILKSNPDLLCQARNELTILKQLRCLNPDTCNVVKLNDVFCHKDYICLALELLDQDLLDYVGERQGGLPMSEIRPIIHQLATALYHLSSIGIVHADIKPENVMLVDRSRQPLKVKLIDFGLAYPVHGKPCAVVQTVGYRAPEVMLDIPFDEAIDMWSLGVTAAELAAGFHPYAGNKDYDVLSLIIKYQGQPRDGLLDCGKKTDQIRKAENGLSVGPGLRSGLVSTRHIPGLSNSCSATTRSWSLLGLSCGPAATRSSPATLAGAQTALEAQLPLEAALVPSVGPGLSNSLASNSCSPHSTGQSKGVTKWLQKDQPGKQSKRLLEYHWDPGHLLVW
uniref:Protein kinase domain-containing protein n=1 Tax=Mola mola TaxID=94237 RepID=A0A3Q4C0B0_MOLML